jgi:uncharacterized damage-inducible protein DinB
MSALRRRAGDADPAVAHVLARWEDPDMADEAVPERWTAAAEHPDMWADPVDDPRDTGQKLTEERGTLLEYLRAYRLTLEMKCADLDAEQLARRSVPPSTMSLLGLLRHLSDVERFWFRRVMGGEDVDNRYPRDGDNGSWSGAVADDRVVTEAWAAWRAEVAAAEAFVASTPDLGTTGTMRNGEAIQLREVMVHMIEEYARHCGHADLLRERIDGRTGQ